MTNRDEKLGLKGSVVALVKEGKRPFSLHTETLNRDGHFHQLVCATFLNGPAELAVFHDSTQAARALHFLKTGEGVE